MGEDAGVRWNLISGRNLDTSTGVIEAPMVISAADLAVDQTANRQIRAEMRTPRALHHRLAGSIAIGNQAIPRHVDPAHGIARDLTREAD
jgi:hypothetical protein